MWKNSNLKISRRSTHGMHDRTDRRGKGRFSFQEVDGWRRKSLVAEASADLSAAHSESSDIPIEDHPAKDITEKSEFYPQGNDGDEAGPVMLEPSDNHAQVISSCTVCLLILCIRNFTYSSFGIIPSAC